MGFPHRDPMADPSTVAQEDSTLQWFQIRTRCESHAQVECRRFCEVMCMSLRKCIIRNDTE